MRTGRTTLATLLALASAAAGPGGCTSTPDSAVEDTRILGAWHAMGDEATLTFTPTGIYMLTVKDVPRPVVGPYQWDQSTGTLTMETRRESAVCGDDTGIYQVRLGGTTLDAKLTRDSCSIRSKLMSQPLRRVATR